LFRSADGAADDVGRAPRGLFAADVRAALGATELLEERRPKAEEEMGHRVNEDRRKDRDERARLRRRGRADLAAADRERLTGNDRLDAMNGFDTKAKTRIKRPRAAERNVQPETRAAGQFRVFRVVDAAVGAVATIVVVLRVENQADREIRNDEVVDAG